MGTTARADTPAQRQLREDGIRTIEQGRMDELLRANLVFAFHPAHAAALAGDYLAMVQRAGAAQLIAQNRAVMAREDLRPHLAGIHCPTLVVVGDSDRLTPPDHAEEIAAAIAQAHLLRLRDCGHLLTWEQPEQVTAALQAWRLGVG
jgi:pimeloyl-ACP methyl ester carboxylesterase